MSKSHRKPKSAQYKGLSPQKQSANKISALPADADRAERLREVLEALIETNSRVPVIVEGKRDASALRELGLQGEIITLHNGKGLYEFSEEIMENYSKIVLLLDWDEKGDQLMRQLEENLKGQFEEFSPFRELLKILCQKDIKDIEGIPSLLKRLEGIAGITGILGAERPGQRE